MVPPEAAQTTAVLLDPDTEAVNCFCPPVNKLAVLGETEIDTCVGCDTVTAAVADLVESAALVEVTA
jgi:hypothetical protein